MSGLSIGARTQLLDMMSVAYGSREGASGGKGNIGMTADGTVVKFNTHLLERLRSPKAGATDQMVTMGNQLRSSMVQLATDLGVSKDVLKGLRKDLGLTATGTETTGTSLLDRKCVAKGVSRLLAATGMDKTAQKDFMAEAAVLSRSTAGLSTDSEHLTSQEAYHSFTRLDETISQEVLERASHNDDAASEQIRFANQNKVVNHLVDLLRNPNMVARYFPGQEKLGEKLRLSMLDMVARKLQFKDGGHLPLSDFNELMGLFTQCAGSELDELSYYDSRDDGRLIEDFDERFGAVMVSDFAQRVQRSGAEAVKSEKPVPVGQKDHPVESGGFKKGMILRQGTNTCFMMSVMNSLLSTEKGTRYVNENLFTHDDQGRSGISSYCPFEDDSPDATDIFNSRTFHPREAAKRGFSSLETTLYSVYSHATPEPEGLGKVGQMLDFATTGLGLRSNDDNSPVRGFTKGLSFLERRKAFAAIANNLWAGNPCVVLRGNQAGGVFKHYMAITDVYSNPDDPEDFGFVVSDSLTGGKRKVKAEYGGDFGYRTDLIVFTFKYPGEFK